MNSCSDGQAQPVQGPRREDSRPVYRGGRFWLEGRRVPPIEAPGSPARPCAALPPDPADHHDFWALALVLVVATLTRPGRRHCCALAHFTGPRRDDTPTAAIYRDQSASSPRTWPSARVTAERGLTEHRDRHRGRKLSRPAPAAQAAAPWIRRDRHRRDRADRRSSRTLALGNPRALDVRARQRDDRRRDRLDGRRLRATHEGRSSVRRGWMLLGQRRGRLQHHRNRRRTPTQKRQTPAEQTRGRAGRLGGHALTAWQGRRRSSRRTERSSTGALAVDHAAPKALALAASATRWTAATTRPRSRCGEALLAITCRRAAGRARHRATIRAAGRRAGRGGAARRAPGGPRAPLRPRVACAACARSRAASRRRAHCRRKRDAVRSRARRLEARDAAGDHRRHCYCAALAASCSTTRCRWRPTRPRSGAREVDRLSGLRRRLLASH